ncbi:hypothetical protein SAMN05444920_102851 [Nonomuraea solani]|uniref:DUF5709 domain-containing protein n=1 Tax=Nonomuraea solani TaxID=1144553 RepID=A0A1H5ZU73_9ACTN|nr:hypothetical protein [Nonomuraea solani]SEG39335.1 hypothetical protein SAMN05444920_102851 [Nonomuraea solani]
MTEQPPDRYGYSDEQEIEVEEWTDDLGFRHEVVPDDPAHHDSLDERLRREAPEKLHAPRPKHQLTQPDEGLEPDVDDEEIGVGYATRDDLSAEERAVRIDPDENLT